MRPIAFGRAQSRTELTNLRLSDLRALSGLVGRLGSANVRRVVIDDSNFMSFQGMSGGDAIMLPRGGNYAALQRYLAGIQH